MLAELKIEKGIPIPDPQSGKVRAAPFYKYPFKKMEVKDSFLVPCEGYERSVVAKRSYSNIRLMVLRGSLEEEFKISARIVDDGVRIWRIS